MLYLFKTIIRIILPVFAAGFLLWSSVSVLAEDGGFSAKDGEITAFRLNVRSGPSNNSSVAYVLKEGAKIKVFGSTEEIGAWIQIAFEGDRGYVRNRPKYLKIIEPVKQAAENPEEKTDKTAAKPDKDTVSDFDSSDGDEDKVSRNAAEKETQEIPESIANDKKNLEKEIEKERKKIISFTKEEKVIIEGLNEIDSTLNEARIRVSNISANLKKLDKKIQQIVKEKSKIIEEYDQKRIYSGTRLNALYRMRMLGKFEVVAEPDSIFDFIVQQRALEKIIESDLKILDEQITTMQRYENLEQDLKLKKKEKLELESELNQQILVTEKKSKRKNSILKKIRTEKRLALVAVKSLKQASRELDKEIEEISRPEFVNKNSRSFRDYRGRLAMPVRGKIISKFGAGKSPDNKIFTFQSGIDIRPRKNDPVKSVFYGKVIFSKWFQGYGNLMIIDHGDNYYSLYAHNKELLKKMDEVVEKGEVIAIAGDTGSIKGLCLHFEIRHHGKPVDPMKWLKKGA